MKVFNLLEQYCENEKLLKINIYLVENVQCVGGDRERETEGGELLKIEQREYYL